MSDKHLDRKTVLNLVYTQQADRMADAYARLKAEVERLISVSEAWKKRRLDKVEAECINWAEVEKENAHLKAIVESHHVDLYLQNARLKAEVERLTAFTTRTIIPNEELQAQVERLTKAGDAMAVALNLNDDVFDNHEKKLAQSDWNAAKETRQP